MISWKLIQKAKTVLEQERGAVHKPWGGRISVCLIYPNHYYVGMSNLGFQVVYQTLNSFDDVVCERAFLPDPEDLREFHQTQTPLFSLESQKCLSDFDLLAFSVSFENDFLNILTLLDLAHIPFESRLREQGYPLILGGGVAIFLNPEPLSEFLDLFVLGEAEEVLPEFLDLFRKAWTEKERRAKGDLLRALSAAEGVYAPAFYEVTYREDGKIERMTPEPGFPDRVKRRWVKEIDRFPSRSTLFTPETEFKEMALVEVNRGCPRKCRFCGACFVYHPFRNRSLPVLETLSGEALAKERRIGLTGTAVSDYSQLLPLCESILSDEGGVSLSSLRVDAITPSLVACLRKGDVRTVAIAPEAGTERLRRVLGKGYGEEQILEAVRILVEQGLSQIKCYFMIGLPSETEEDVEEITHLAKRIRHQILSSLGSRKERWRVVLSVNPFIPKPSTPFQWVAMEKVDRLKKKLRAIQRGLKGERGMEMIHDLPKWAYIQALLSRGDRRVARILAAAHRWQGDWGKALQETSVNPDFFIHRTRDLDEIFPWDFIDHGISKETLKREYLTAMGEAGITVNNDR